MKKENIFIKTSKIIAKHMVNCHVFISYSTENFKEANKIKKIIEKYGGKIFIAPSSIAPGNNFKDDIKSNIDSCDIFIPLISQKTVRSPFVNQEIGYALPYKKRILPITIGKIKEKNMAFLSDLQCIQFEDKKLENMIKKKILKKYLKVISSWVVILLLFFLIKWVGK